MQTSKPDFCVPWVRWLWLGLAAFSLLSSPWTVGGFQEPAEPPLPNFDLRREAARRAGPPGADRAAAVAQLRARVPGLRVDWDELGGRPVWLGSPAGFLSGPQGQGRGIGAETARGFAAADPHRAVKAFLKEHAALVGHGPEALAQARIQRESIAPRHGLRTTVWQQHVDELPVFEARLISQVTRDGELVSLGSQFVPDPERAANAGLPNRAARVKAPAINARQALRLAAANLREAELPLDTIVALDGPPAGHGQPQRFKAGALPGESRARLMWVPMPDGSLRLAWEVELTRRRGGRETYRLAVDAETGEVLLRHCRTFYLSDATYHVFASDSPTPFSPALSVPGTNQPSVGPRTRITLGALSTNASPIGWISDGENETRGNNVDAHTDHNADDEPDLPRPQGSPFREFDFPVDLGQSPLAYSDAAVVQLFYWGNWVHDRFYELGFTEAAGNFQKDNFGRGGLGNDAVQADAQDGAGVNNARFTPSVDGVPGRVEMFIFDGPEPDRDGDLDAEIVLHEYTHGLTDRLVGGGAGIYQWQTFGLGEGWSDFYALALLGEPSDDLDGTYPEGGYATLEYFGLTENYYYGIRRYPYSTDLTKNPLTFRDIDPTQISLPPEVPFNPTRNPDPALAGEPHRAGEVWCVTLWDVRANLIRKHGFATGAELTLQLVTDGLKLSPPNPTFIQARDAILLADRVNTGGENQTELWAAFAKRGMGVGAFAPPNWTTEGVIESFSRPDLLAITPVDLVGFSGLPGGPLQPACRTYALTNGTSIPLAWVTGGGDPFLSVSPAGGTLEPGTAVAVEVCPAAAATTLSPGRQVVALFFTNLTTGVPHRRDVELRTLESATMPFTEDFERGDLAGYWTVTGRGPGQAQVGNAGAPRGTHHLTLAGGADGLRARNEVTLTVDLAGYTNVVLRFWAKEFNDQPDGPPPSPFLDGADFDGVAISEDGYRWFEVQDLRRLREDYAEWTVDLDAAAARHGLSYHSAFRLRFNQAGYRRIPDHGIALDDISLTGIAPRRFAVVLPAEAREGDGVLAGLGRVRLPVPVNAEVTVALASTDPAAVTVPATVIIPAGAMEATFDLTIVDDARLDGDQTSLITASAPGFFGGGTVLSVRDNETATLVLSVPASVRESEGVLLEAGQVSIDAVPDRDIVIQLSSSVPAELQVPAAVVLPAGTNRAAFHLAVADDNVIDGTQVVEITAAVPNWTSATTPVAVRDNESTNLSLTLPSLLNEGTTTLVGAAAVRLGGVIPTNLVVSLASSLTNRLGVPAAVVVSAGQSSASFALSLFEDAVWAGAQVAAITATATAFGPGSGAVRLLDNEQPPLPFAPRPPHLSRTNLVNTGLAWNLGVSEVVVNGGFETGGFGGWRKQNSGDGDWIINAGAQDPPGPEGASPPFAGQYAAQLQQQGPGRHVLSQDFQVPVFVDSVRLSWSDRIRNPAGAFSETHGFRVEIRDLADEVLAVAFATQPGDTALNDWIERDFSLMNFRGTHIRVAFVGEDSLGYLNVGLDNVRVMLGFGGTTTSEVYFGTNAAPGVAEFQGDTTGTTWALPPLELNTTYYWQIVARRGLARTPGPVWQFAIRGLGPLDHFVWSPVSPQQALGQPFAVTLTAKDAFENTVTSFGGSVGLSARTGRAAPLVQVLTFTRHTSLGREYRHTLGAIAAAFTNYLETRFDAEDAAALEAQLIGKDVFLVVEQQFAPREYLGGLGEAWALVLGNYVNSGGTLVVCSASNDEHELLNRSGLLSLTKLGTAPTAGLVAPAEHPLLEGVATPFTGYNLATYATENGQVLLQTAGEEPGAVVVTRPLGSGQVVMIGTDYLTNRSGLDRVLVNTVRQAARDPSRPVSLTPGFSGYFENGTWTGNVTVWSPGADITLHADDQAGHGGASQPFTVAVANDLSVEIADLADPLPINSNLVFHVTVRNSGPLGAADVVLTNQLPAELGFVDATASQGSCVLSNDTVVCRLGALPDGAAVAVTIVAAPLAGGRIINSVGISGAGDTDFPGNNVATVETRVNLPALSIANANLTEGDAGTSAITFQLHLRPPSRQAVSCAFATADVTATAGADYLAATGVVVFAPGVTNQSIAIPVVGDTIYEGFELFHVNLFNPTNAILGNLQGAGSIVENDPRPVLSVSDATVVEGRAGTTTNAVFTLNLSTAAALPVTVNFSTADAGAAAKLDYAPVSGRITFAPGVTNQTLLVVVRGDNESETNESFHVNYSGEANVVLERTRSVGTIFDDDAGVIHHFTWSDLDPLQYLDVPFAATVTARDGFDNVIADYTGPIVFPGLTGGREILIGGGGGLWEFPLGTSFHDARVQSIYLASEVGEAGRITSLALNIAELPGQTLGRWTIRLKHTAASEYTASAWVDDGWTVVHQKDEIITAPGWVTFHFEAPFEFNGTDNLLVDFSFNNATFSSDGTCRFTATPDYRSLYFRTDSGFGDPLAWAGGENPPPLAIRRVPDIRLGVESPVAISASSASNFVQGVWSGFFTVHAVVPSMRLRAEDGRGHFGTSGSFRVAANDDLALTVTESHDPGKVAEPLTYSFVLTNSGPSTAAGVVLSNPLPPGLRFVSAVASQGACEHADGRVVCDLGAVPGEGTASVSVSVVPTASGLVTNVAHAGRAGPDAFPGNNTAQAVTRINPPSLFVGDVTVMETPGSPTGAVFTVRLSSPQDLPVSVDYFTSDGTTSNTVDYLPRAGTLLFPPGATNQAVTIAVADDTTDEGNEVFFLNLTNATNAVIAQNRGTGTILDDDPPPSLFISDAQVVEGHDGNVVLMVPVRLSERSARVITARYATSNGTAVAGTDYQSVSGNLTFPATLGIVSRTVNVVVFGDRQIEPSETLTVTLSQPSNVTLSNDVAVGTIVNDDGLPGVLERFEWSAISATQRVQQPIPVTLTAKDFSGATVGDYTGGVMLSGRTGGGEVPLGLGNSASRFPLASGYHDVRLSSIYLAGEVGGPRTVLGLALEVLLPPGQTLHDWTIRLKHTALTSFASAVWEGTGWTTVFRGDVTIPTNGWVTFPFTTAFEYDGTRNLMVDFSFDNAYYTIDGQVRFSNISGPRSIALETDSAFGEPVTWAGLVPVPAVLSGTPSIRLLSGFPVEVTPAFSGNFSNGVWTGWVTVREPATNLFLVADDGLGHVGASELFSAELILDADVDGLPDAWEREYFGSLNAPGGEPGDDPDGDGWANWQELAGGTHPREPASVLRIAAVEILGANVRIAFHTIAGRRYRIEAVADPGQGGWREMGPDFAGAGGLMQWTDVGAGSRPLRFYRVRLLP